MAVAKLWESVLLSLYKEHDKIMSQDITMVEYAIWFLKMFFLKDQIRLSSHYRYQIKKRGTNVLLRGNTFLGQLGFLGRRPKRTLPKNRQ